MKILDISAGNRAIWFDKNYRDTLYIDCREEIKPQIVCDSKQLPIDTKSKYNLIVFDPPHVNFGASAEMSKTYGHHTTQDIKNIVEKSAKSTYAVAADDALMAFKWNNHDQSLKNILQLLLRWWEPLFGNITSQRTKHASTTQWILLRKRERPLDVVPPVLSKRQQHIHDLLNEELF